MNFKNVISIIEFILTCLSNLKFSGSRKYIYFLKLNIHFATNFAALKHYHPQMRHHSLTFFLLGPWMEYLACGDLEMIRKQAALA